MTKTSSAFQYRYGTIQISVTKSNGKITAIDVGSSGATGGRQAAFPYLVQYAIAANGSNFGNLSGATFTSETFKQALAEVLTKF